MSRESAIANARAAIETEHAAGVAYAEAIRALSVAHVTFAETNHVALLTDLDAYASKGTDSPTQASLGIGASRAHWQLCMAQRACDEAGRALTAAEQARSLAVGSLP